MRQTYGKIILTGMCSNPINANRLRCQSEKWADIGTFNTECNNAVVSHWFSKLQFFAHIGTEGASIIVHRPLSLYKSDVFNVNLLFCIRNLRHLIFGTIWLAKLSGKRSKCHLLVIHRNFEQLEIIVEITFSFV